MTIVEHVSAAMRAAADPERAGPMAAYMKTTMPFHGVDATARRAIGRDTIKRFQPADRADYEANVRALWAMPHREEKYVAIQYARVRRFVGIESLPIYQQMIVEGAWWDFVDEIAAHILGGILARDRAALWVHLDAWIEDPDLWLRRAALLSQLRARSTTDADRLFRWCRRCMPEREFFIRKAIGWALRTYGETAPESVAAFLAAHKDEMSGLSYREGRRTLVKQGFDCG